MEIEELKKKIEEYLKTSTISQHKKNMITILLPIMERERAENIYKTLKEEKEKISKIHKQKERVELKYKVMAEKLHDLEKK